MSLYTVVARLLASRFVEKERRRSACAVDTQYTLLQGLIARGRKTRFGQDHHFDQIHTYADFQRLVPVRDYEGLLPYFNRVLQGERDVFWPGRPLYMAKTSGTTSGVKYIPITRDSIPNHIRGTRDALLHYIHETGNASFLGGKWIFLSGSPALERVGSLKVGRLSGIVNHHVPFYLRGKQLPSYATNCVNDWEQKLDLIVEETHKMDMTLVSGIPPWVQMYFKRLIEKTGKTVSQLFPNLSLLVYGGVNVEPYRAVLGSLLGKEIDTLELYPASEGFLAYQDRRDEPGLRLCTGGSGIFFEFIPEREYSSPNPRRLSLGQVELGENYALVLSSNAGLWAYSIGDTVRFVSLDPHRVVVTGRLSHFISAFGEHVIAEEIDRALASTLAAFPRVRVSEFTVAPQIASPQGLSHHQWLVEFIVPPDDPVAFSQYLDGQMCGLNIYYRDLVEGGILSPLQVTALPQGTFLRCMRAAGRLGGQNKVPRLANDRLVASELLRFVDSDPQL